MPLADGDDLVARYDGRRVGDLAVDDDTRPLTANVPTLPAVLVAIADATDEVLAAIRVSNRYAAADLADPVTPAEGGTGRPIVKRLICDLAFGLLNDRRGYASGDEAQLAPRVDQARLMLEQLRRGERILDTQSHADAGLPQVGDANNSGGVVGQAWRFFGVPPGERC